MSCVVFVLSAVLSVREEFLPVLQPQQTHARALRRTAIQVCVLQQGGRPFGFHLIIEFATIFIPALTRYVVNRISFTTETSSYMLWFDTL